MKTLADQISNNEVQQAVECQFLSDWSLIAVNDQFTDLFGEIDSTSFLELTTAEDRAIVQAALDSMGMANPLVSFEVRTTRTGEHPTWIYWTVIQQVDEKSHGIVFRALGRDITLQKEAEKSGAEGIDSDHREWEIALVLAVMRQITSSLDLDEVLHLFANAVLDLTDTQTCGLSYYDEESDSVITWLDVMRKNRDLADSVGSVYPLEKFPTTRRVIEENEAVIVRASDPNADPAEVELMRQQDISVMLMLPLIVQDEIIGLLEVNRIGVERYFSPQEVQLCRALADQAALAIKNARLHQEVQEQARQQMLLREAGTTIQSAMTWNEVMTHLAEQLAHALDATSTYIIDYDHDNQSSTVIAEYFSASASADEIVSDLGQPFYFDKSTRKLLTSLLDGNACHGFLVDGHDPLISDDLRKNYQKYGAQSVLIVPMHISGAPIGFIEIWDTRRERTFTPAECDIVVGIAQQAALALERAMLFKDLSQNNSSLKDLVDQRTLQVSQMTERVQAILDSNADTILLLDEQGRIQETNRTFGLMFGISEEEAIGEPVTIVLDEDSHGAFQDKLDAIEQGSEAEHVEVLAAAGDGHLFDAAVALSRFTSDSNEMGFVCNIRDVSELKRVQHMKDMFVANVSHEFRTPITNFILYLTLLEKQPDNTDTYMEILKRESQRLRSLVDDVLMVSRLQQNTIRNEQKPVELRGLVQEYVDDRRELANSHDLTLVEHTNSDSIVVSGDAALLGQVANNLITNAISYTPSGGTITVVTDIQADDDAQWGVLEVTNTGPGIHPDEQQYLFERFFRGKTAQQANLPGTGLGLAICKEIIALHRGTIDVESSPNTGTTFSVRLPLAEG